jgi:hypothetical protein
MNDRFVVGRGGSVSQSLTAKQPQHARELAFQHRYPLFHGIVGREWPRLGVKQVNGVD